MTMAARCDALQPQPTTTSDCTPISHTLTRHEILLRAPASPSDLFLRRTVDQSTVSLRVRVCINDQ